MVRCSTPRAARSFASARFLTLLCLLLTASARAEVFFVNAAATGEPQDGHSWKTAFRSIQAAVDTAAAGDEVWVATGRYGSTRIYQKPVHLYGGFAGTESARDQRDPRLHRTEVEGGSDPAFTVQSVSAGCTIDGFAIHSSNRGIALDRTSRATLAGNIIARCGVGVYQPIQDFGAGLTITANTFHLNGSGLRTGGFVALVDNLFLGNRTGAHLADPQRYSSSAYPELLRNRFIGNGIGAKVIYLATRVLCNTFERNTSGLQFNAGTSAINNTFVGNDAAIHALPSYPYRPYGLIQNNLIASNGIGIRGMVWATSTQVGDGGLTIPNIVHNCFFENQTDMAYTLAVEGSIHADPMIARDEAGRIHIQPDSPCRDAGRVSTSSSPIQDAWLDLDGQGRIQGASVDIGADESDGTVWPEAPEPRVVYVRPDGDDRADGASWATSRRTIQAGVIEAALRSGEVWAAAGEYRENVELLPNVSLYGGFAGTEARRDERDPTRTASRIVAADTRQPIVDAWNGLVPATLEGFTLAGGGLGVRVGAPGFTVRRCRFLANEVGVEARLSTVVDGCILKGNAVAIVCGGRATPTAVSQPKITNTVFAGNGIGVRCVQGAEPSLAGNTFLLNTAGVSVNDTVAATILNCLFVKNDVGVERNGTAATVTARHINAWGNGTGWQGISDPTGQHGNIALDPKLVSENLGDIHLLPGSPCVDAGDGTAVRGATDVDGQPRIQGAGVDIGADEADGAVRTATPRTVRVSPTGDDGNDGAAWASAMRSLGAALDAAAATGGEVWVADGTYRENARLMPFVSALGGFRGSEASAAERQPARGGTVLEPADAEAATLTAMTGAAPVALDGLTLRNGGTALFCDASAPAVTGNWFEGNLAAIHAFFRSRPVIAGNVFAANGSGVVCDDAAQATVRNNTMLGNETGVYVSHAAPVLAGNLVAEGGTGLDVAWLAAPTVVNNTVARNETGAMVQRWSTPLLANSIFALNGAGIRAFGPGVAPTLRHNLVGANATDYRDLPDATGADGNLSAHPMLLVDGPGGYRLWRTSPAIDAGDDAYLALAGTDLDGADRPIGAHIDLGAYEYRGTADLRAHAVAALQVAGGLSPASSADPTFLDRDVDGQITQADAIGWLREHLTP